MDSGYIKVKRYDGEEINVENLSGGTYDQLYFCIRIALGEKILYEHPGFFILDDPFIKSDPMRLNNQINMLRKISDYGWQILYFSSKKEIKEAFSEDIKFGNINYIELEDLFSKGDSLEESLHSH